LEIRRATIDDLELIKEIKLEAKASERTYNKSLKPIEQTKELYFSYLKSDLENSDRAVFIAIDQDKPVGIITGRIYTTLLIRRLPKKGHISNLFIEPTHRKKGLASKLANELLNWFKTEGIEDVHLGAALQNDPALQMFKKLGFQEYAIEMKKSL
jgi:ribosomal protein S18 acetylase RimI-like enzyme